MIGKALTEDLRRFLPSDRILDTDLWREIYARDASYFDIKPQCIVRPATVAEVGEVIAAAKRHGCGVTFRAGGSSLSGQTVGTGIICELRTDWKKYEVRDGGRKVWFEPGLTVNQINAILKPHMAHLGPDPASSSAAMMGGVLANNSSGMEAGTRYNSYHLLSSIEFMLPNGHRYDTAIAADRARFKVDEANICRGLLEIRSEILADDEMRNKIVSKYKIKNVTGYAMNSFVDFEDPVDIFSHLLIGSEGTLAYIISAEQNTRPLFPVYSSAMLYFPSVVTASSYASWLGQSGALAVEMMDYASLVSASGLPDNMPAGTTALLVDYGAESSEAMADLIGSLEPKIRSLKNLIGMSDFTHTVQERTHYWDIRNGIFPCVAGARVPGATVILEDVAAPVEQLDRLVEGVQYLFDKYGYKGAIFGHARDGNIHPLLTSPIDAQKDLERFKDFMGGFVDHVLSLNGSLKGEHGTGRAIAPFVAREWGDKIYALMCRLKILVDPDGVMNPGVIINNDPEAYIKPMKSMDIFGAQLGYDKADKCIECGCCEHVCPSRYVTLTPRQRLQARRIIVHNPGNAKLQKEYSYIGRETCCTDGSCQMPCPMGINTAVITDAVRREENPRLFTASLSAAAEHYGAFETSVRDMLKVAVVTQKVISPYPLIWAADFLHKIYAQVPHWSKLFPMPAKLHYKEVENPDFIYFPACVTRIFGASNYGKDDLITVVLRIAAKAGLKVSVPKDVHGICCSQIWEHKGDPKGQAVAANKAVETFYKLSDGGRIPIFCDTTSCTHTILMLGKKEGLFTEENARKFKALKVLDITIWLRDHVIPRLRVSKPEGSVLLHPTCASSIMGVASAMEDVARACSEDVVVPNNTHCCGAAGDRGFVFPEVARSAVRDEKNEVAGRSFDGYYSLARTCEISLLQTMDRPYESIVYLVDETTEAK